VADPTNWIWDTAPACIVRDSPPGIPFSAEVMAPFQGCTDVGGGFFTFGPGRQWFGGGYVYLTPEGGSTGDVLYGGSAGLYILTVLGVAVMILVFIAFVWTEHRKLMDRASKLRAAAAPSPTSPMASGEGGGSAG
jgi:hypothetical protein